MASERSTQTTSGSESNSLSGARRSAGFLDPASRHRLARITRWRYRLREVPLDRLLLGGQNGVPAAEFAALLDDQLWPSRRVIDGPHAALLAAGSDLSDEEILRSSYGQMALASIRHTGAYFEATDEVGVLAVARAFLARNEQGDSSEPVTGNHHSAPGQPVLVVPIKDSDCYQVIDGHHRVALLAAQGSTSVPVRVRRGNVQTPLQQLLREMSWLEGGRELYQPLDFPELEAKWPVVRRCTDRLEAMESLLGRLRGHPASGSYLDVASCYGWFVAQMGRAGLSAEGMERDPLGATIGKLAYGVEPEQIRIGDAVTQLREAGRRWDVVSCFSLLHHFVLGRGSCDEVELIQLLDGVTGHVLFFDTGQENEKWFKTSLKGWNPATIREFLLTNTTFDEVIDLGPDRDAVGPYAENYSRHLFACIRSNPR